MLLNTGAPWLAFARHAWIQLNSVDALLRAGAVLGTAPLILADLAVASTYGTWLLGKGEDPQQHRENRRDESQPHRTDYPVPETL